MVGVNHGLLVHSSCSVRFTVKTATASSAQHIPVIANRPAAWKLVGSIDSFLICIGPSWTDFAPIAHSKA
ncbi:hypothetical protein PILCRDRAFT_815491 [Piloderma croceum F 1598]|uniref:Uncharacterized protein n=1 Tax=Piloderma croceum (strain F 1598) TaxID=765440 RepID=A0A0C3BKS5_PILCF|nr:hypothetical protein PILCRDRAFT_815491 [Piloderma croceum F 1598]